MSAVPALVLFDLDGVLCHYSHQVRLDVLAQRSGKSADEVKAALFDSGLESDSDRGLYTPQGQAEELSRRLDARLSVDDCVDARKASMSVDAPMLALAQAVSRHAGVAILTNNGLMLRDYLPRICPPLFPLFSARVFCSAQFKIEKPAEEIYRRCLAALGVAEANALFVDDNPANAEGARKAGLQAIHFTGEPALRAELTRLGAMGSVHAT